MYHSATVGVQVACTKNKSEFWANVIKFVKKQRVAKGKLLNASDCNRNGTRWNDLDDSLLAYVFVQSHEVIVD